MLGDSDKLSSFSGHAALQKEFAFLAELCGIHADPNIYRIIIELLEMQIDPEAIYKLLRSIRRSNYNSKQAEKQSEKAVRRSK